MITKIPGGVTAARGFKASSCAAGIKYQNRTDMAMIACDVPCAAAGTFTTNLVKAAPVVWDMDVIHHHKQAQAVVVNAGIANAATGAPGMDLCRKTAECTAGMLQIPVSSVLLGSTGVIGPMIPLDRISAGIVQMASSLSPSLESGTEASKAIMTTDTVNKEFAVSFDMPAADGAGTVTVHLGGMSKGSGMIHPNMSTMLAYITTDCAISQSLMQQALSAVVQDTFNMITVDGDTSTNDTLLLLASGLAGNRAIDAADENYDIFCKALLSVCRDLAVTMAGDGEGATHLVEMHVLNADTVENARILAKSVVGSSLVKAMIYGKDANCGRILCALGYAGPKFDPSAMELYLNGKQDSVCFYKNGHVQDFDEDLALKIMSEHDVHFSADMKMGTCEATAWGCDLTYDYVKINGDYRS